MRFLKKDWHPILSREKNLFFKNSFNKNEHINIKCTILEASNADTEDNFIEKMKTEIFLKTHFSL